MEEGADRSLPARGVHSGGAEREQREAEGEEDRRTALEDVKLVQLANFH